MKKVFDDAGVLEQTFKQALLINEVREMVNRKRHND